MHWKTQGTPSGIPRTTFSDSHGFGCGYYSEAKGFRVDGIRKLFETEEEAKRKVLEILTKRAKQNLRELEKELKRF